MKHKFSTFISRILLVTVIFGFTAVAFGVVYSAALFRDLESLMAQNIRFQPTILYSDLYSLHKGASFANTFLTERLSDLKIAFVRTPEDASANNFQISWKSTGFNYPNALIATDSPLRLASGATINVTVKDQTIELLEVNGAPVEEVLIDPVAIAQISGASREIRNYTHLDQIPTKLLQAIIAIENQRFLEHVGFDIKSLARALWVNLR